MAIYCEFHNLIIPIKNVERVYPGGFTNYLDTHLKQMWLGYWYDDYLIRSGAMDDNGIDIKVQEFKDLGLNGQDENGVWKDFCVVSVASGTPPKCEWLKFGSHNGFVFMTGTPTDSLKGPSVRSGWQAIRDNVNIRYWSERLGEE